MRRLIRRLALPVLVGVLAVIGQSAGAAGIAPPPSTASQERGMVTGRPLQDPEDADTDGRQLAITLDAAGNRFDLAGRAVRGQSYNGSFVAPTIHARPGSRGTIVLVNHLRVATSLHFHGLHVSPAGDADNPFVCVAPGGTFTYHLDLPADHPLGTYWYHSHAMGTSCPAPMSPADSSAMPQMSGMPGMSATSGSSTFVPGNVENQIFAGLSGALIVGDDRRLLPPALRSVTTHTLVLKDAQIDASGYIVQNTDSTSINSNNPTVRLVNGQLRPVLSMGPGQTQLWRLVNAGADIIYRLQLDGYRFTVIGEDGVPVAQVTTPDTLLLPPGKRYDVLVTARNGGRTTLRTTAYSNGPQGDSYPDTTLAKVLVTGPPATSLPTVSGPIATAPADLSQARIAEHRTVDLSEDAAGTSFYLNGKQFTMDAGSVFTTPAHLGTVEEWTILNHSGEDHPFHLHTTHFQVVSLHGTPWPYTHAQDTVVVPHAVNGVPGKAVIRIAFTDYPGKWMFHCHIAAHEDNGMMSYINVAP
jgi:FtsP/CotA-like multicopper oxidase with cupredoxin domain